MDDIFADRSGGSARVGFGAPVEIGDDIHGGPGRQPVRRPVSLEAVVWASPVFVVGCPRSGTTLVQTMLDSRPRLSVICEADCLVDIPLGLRSSHANASEALTFAEAHPNFRTDSFDARTASAACRELGITDNTGAMRVLAASQTLAQGKKRWGNKAGYDKDLIAMEDADPRLRASARAMPTDWRQNLEKFELSSQLDYFNFTNGFLLNPVNCSRILCTAWRRWL
jgi:hypothetical protein